MKNVNRAFFCDLDNFLKIAEETFTYEKIFDLTGTSDLLKSMYIETVDLNKDYVSIIFKCIKDFKKQPLYQNLDLNNEKDLKFLRSDKDFILRLKKTIGSIKEKLIPRHTRVLEFLLEFESKKHIPLKDILNATNFDRSSLLFILDDLKKTGKIYDYNGREAILK